MTKTITYSDFTKNTEMVLCNNIRKRIGETLEPLDYDTWYDEESDEYFEIYQWFIIDRFSAERMHELSDAIIFYDEELEIYVLGVTHLGTSWNYVYIDVDEKY